LFIASQIETALLHTCFSCLHFISIIICSAPTVIKMNAGNIFKLYEVIESR